MHEGAGFDNKNCLLATIGLVLCGSSCRFIGRGGLFWVQLVKRQYRYFAGPLSDVRAAAFNSFNWSQAPTETG